MLLVIALTKFRMTQSYDYSIRIGMDNDDNNYYIEMHRDNNLGFWFKVLVRPALKIIVIIIKKNQDIKNKNLKHLLLTN